jgi:hypothetical protein
VISWRLIIVAFTLGAVLGDELVELLDDAPAVLAVAVEAVLNEPSASSSCLPRSPSSAMIVFRSGVSTV